MAVARAAAGHGDQLRRGRGRRGAGRPAADDHGSHEDGARDRQPRSPASCARSPSRSATRSSRTPPSSSSTRQDVDGGVRGGRGARPRLHPPRPGRGAAPRFLTLDARAGPAATGERQDRAADHAGEHRGPVRSRAPSSSTARPWPPRGCAPTATTLEELMSAPPPTAWSWAWARSTATGRPENARCAVVAYDYTVLAGTQGANNHQKIDRMMRAGPAVLAARRVLLRGRRRAAAGGPDIPEGAARSIGGLPPALARARGSCPGSCRWWGSTPVAASPATPSCWAAAT